MKPELVNIRRLLVTLPTAQLEISLLKALAPLNKPAVSVTLAVSDVSPPAGMAWLDAAAP